jgi:hypothetical protein
LVRLAWISSRACHKITNLVKMRRPSKPSCDTLTQKTTRRPYIKKNVVSEKSRKAMNRLAQVFKKLQKPARRHSLLATNVGTSRMRKSV